MALWSFLTIIRLCSAVLNIFPFRVVEVNGSMGCPFRSFVWLQSKPLYNSYLISQFNEWWYASHTTLIRVLLLLCWLISIINSSFMWIWILLIRFNLDGVRLNFITDLIKGVVGRKLAVENYKICVFPLIVQKQIQCVDKTLNINSFQFHCSIINAN